MSPCNRTDQTGREGNAMARDVYHVVKHQGEWKITYNQKHYGPYDSQRKAIAVAVDTAHKAGGNNASRSSAVTEKLMPL
jgi:hypothetical protein